MLTSSLPLRWCVISLMCAVSLGAFSCREGAIDGDGDGDADVDGDSDSDVDGDGDSDGDPPGCTPALGGPCNPVAQCGCSPGQLCALIVMDDAVREGCAAGDFGSGGHGDPCPEGICAAGHICLQDGGGSAVCLALCEEHDDCPVRSLCDVAFTMGGHDPSPYRACSPQRAEADAIFGVCTAPAGDCPGAGTTVRELDSTTGSWSCSLEVGDDEIVMDFELSAGGHAIRGSDLLFPNVTTTLVPMTCGEFEIVDDGTSYRPGECVSGGMPESGECTIYVEYSHGQVNGTFRCYELPGVGGDTLTTMNGGETGAGSFAFRACQVTEI